MTAIFRNATLALASGGLALAAPASALPAAHYAAWNVSPVHGSTAGYDEDEDGDRGDRGRHRGWDKHHGDERRYESRSTYRQPSYRQPSYRQPTYRQPTYRPQAYYNNYPASYGEPVYNNTRVWQGQDGRYYCRKSNGTTGLLVGGAVGALLGREVVGRRGDRTLGAILGAAGGALLGKSLDSRTRCN